MPISTVNGHPMIFHDMPMQADRVMWKYSSYPFATWYWNEGVQHCVAAALPPGKGRVLIIQVAG
jgi:hypothetical protein